ncbi:large ribosomal subunit protein bL9m-like, partial [Ruditapes philippinarum]|uniref:large ribosomal subunit protein bL9m-like n=1 Tax=Ruditapes philippinarum TaxID=129788 RepID=UPI00295A7E50
MLACLRQSYQCTCRCWLQYSSRGLCTTDTKFFENPATAVFERKHKIGLVAVGKYPLLKKKHYLLDKLKHPGDYKSTIKCILTKEITDIGLKGTVVEVPKKLFRNELYPSGAAVYASPENLILYEDLRKV